MNRIKQDCLISLVTNILAQSGYHFVISSNMREWCQHMTMDGSLVSPQFDEKYTNQSTSRWLGIFDANHKLSATIAWRTFYTADLMEEIESGRYLFDNPASIGFQRIKSGLHDHIRTKGRVFSRGGIKSWDRGKRLSWYACTLAMSIADRDNYDISLGTAFPSILESAFPLKMYGYANQNLLPVHYWPNINSWAQVAMVWSTNFQIRKEVEHRTRFLINRDDPDLRRTVDAFNPAHYSSVST